MNLPFAAPSNWRTVPFSEIIADSAFGPRFSRESYATDGNVATLRTTDLEVDGRISYETMPLARLDQAKFRAHFLKNGDLVITRSGTCGIAAVFDGFELPVLPGAFLIRFRLAPDAEPKFYRYFFNSQIGRGHLLSMATGAVQQNLNITNVSKLNVPLPPVTDQRAIVGILSAYDDLIENNTRRTKILEEMAQIIYREWFVNFHFPGHEKVQMVESELGSTPEGWVVQTLGELADITMGQSPPSESYNSVRIGLPFHQGVTDFGARFPTDRTYCIIENRLAEPQDILMSVRAPVGRLNISTKKIVIGRGLCAIRSKLDSQAILFQQLREHFREEDTMGSGTIFKAVTKQDVHGIKFIKADDKIATELKTWLRPLFRQLEVLSSKNTNLRTTRDLLLPKLISGEISVEATAELVAQPA